MICTLLAVVSAQGQIAFQNLDFEAAHNLPLAGGDVAISNAMPSWTAFAGSNVLATIPYNIAYIVPQVGLYGSNTLEISGAFSVLLRGNGSISQTGLIPGDAESLIFKGRWTSLTPLEISLGGQSLSYIAISSGADYTLYGAEISAFSGETVRLDFLATTPSFYLIDDIQFSPQVIPEPSSLAVLVSGGIIAANRFVRRRKANLQGREHQPDVERL